MVKHNPLENWLSRVPVGIIDFFRRYSNQGHILRVPASEKTGKFYRSRRKMKITDILKASRRQLHGKIQRTDFLFSFATFILNPSTVTIPNFKSLTLRVICGGGQTRRVAPAPRRAARTALPAAAVTLTSVRTARRGQSRIRFRRVQIMN